MCFEIGLLLVLFATNMITITIKEDKKSQKFTLDYGAWGGGQIIFARGAKKETSHTIILACLSLNQFSSHQAYKMPKGMQNQFCICKAFN